MDTNVASRRRLRGKQIVGELAVQLAIIGMAAQPTLEFAWQKAMLVREDLSPEEMQSKRRVYLVTLPHPKHCGGDAKNLKAPGNLTRQDVISMFLDCFRWPAYVDAGAAARGAPTLLLEKMVVFQETTNGLTKD